MLPSLLTVVKYGFISMVVTGAGFLIGNVIVVKHHTVEALDDLVYKPRTSRHLEDTAHGLDFEYSKCFTQPTKTYCLGNAKELLRILDDDSEIEREDDIDISDDGIHRHPVHTLLEEFSGFLHTLGIRAVILEPSMLFCSISSSNKYNLLVRDFNPHHYQGSVRTVTVGIFQEDASILDAAIWGDLKNKTPPSSFESFRTRRWLIDVESGDPVLHSVHFLFYLGRLEVHGVVLFPTHALIWHAGTDMPSRDLLFSKDGTFENFTAVPLVIKSDPELVLYLPGSPVQFLFQIPNSYFISCEPSDDVQLYPHPTLTDDQLVHRAVVAIQELKAAFQPHFVNFWLWKESLSGWFKSCNIFEETFEMNIAVSHSSVKRLNLTAILTNNNYLNVLKIHHMDGSYVGATLDCYGLKINIFFCHEERESVWYLQQTEQEVDTKSVFPFQFRLCSTDVLGQRIYVPCEAEQILQLQNGQLEVATANALELN